MTAARRLGRASVSALTATVLATTLVVLSAGTAAADPSVDDMEEKIEQQAADLEGVVEDYNAASEELKTITDDVEELEEKLAPYEEELDKLYDKSEPIVKAAYMGQPLDDVNAMLEAGSPEVFTDKLAALDGITATNSAIIDEVSGAAKEYLDQKESLDGLKAEQKALKAELEESKDSIEDDIDRLQEDRKQAFRDEAAARGESVDFVPDYVPGDRGVVVRHAMDQLGDPYVWASSGPDSYDCSGLILDAYQQIGISMPHNAAKQYDQSTRISREDLQPGDSVFYNGLQHVGMYIGEDYVVHAPTFGDVVKIDTIDDAATPYYGAGTYL